MKNITIVILLFFLIYSCKSNPKTTEVLPIIYLGTDTTYDNRPKEDYCIHTKRISLINADSVIFKTQSTPFAPLDSPYGLHGGSRTYHGRILNINDNSIKIKWDFNPQKDIICNDENKSSYITEKGLNVTIINFDKDTLCIGNIECVKQNN